MNLPVRFCYLSSKMLLLIFYDFGLCGLMYVIEWFIGYIFVKTK